MTSSGPSRGSHRREPSGEHAGVCVATGAHTPRRRVSAGSLGYLSKHGEAFPFLSLTHVSPVLRQVGGVGRSPDGIVPQAHQQASCHTTTGPRATPAGTHHPQKHTLTHAPCYLLSASSSLNQYCASCFHLGTWPCRRSAMWRPTAGKFLALPWSAAVPAQKLVSSCEPGAGRSFMLQVRAAARRVV